MQKTDKHLFSFFEIRIQSFLEKTQEPEDYLPWSVKVSLF